MILWKLIDGRLIHSENMNEGDALAAGYKPLVWTLQPDIGFYHDEWTESEAAIVRTWTEIVDPDPTDTDKAEAYDILMGVNT